MRKSLFAPLGAVVASLAALTFAFGPRPAEAVTADAATYTIDTSHSSLVFKIRRYGINDFYGRFNDVRGTLTYDEDDLSASSISVTVAAASVDSANGNRDNHLRSQDFFNATQFPRITFTSSSITKDGDDLVVNGELELLGKKRPVTARASYGGSAEVRGKTVVGFTATFTIRRTDFGMDYGLADGSLGDEVEVILAIEAGKG